MQTLFDIIYGNLSRIEKYGIWTIVGITTNS